VYDGTLLAALEMIEGGTTTFADMYYFESEAARAVDKAGMRAVLGETFIDFPVPDHKDLAATLALMTDYVKRWKGHPRITPAAAPHALYTNAKESLLARRRFALREGIPILIHVAETKKELEDARKNWQQSPVCAWRRSGSSILAGGRAGADRAAHGVWMDEKDRALVKQYGAAVSHNPESNMKLSSGIADVTAWQAEGLSGASARTARRSNNDLPCSRRWTSRASSRRSPATTRPSFRRACSSRPRPGAARGRWGCGEDRLARARQAGGPHLRGRPQRPCRAVRGCLFGARVFREGVGRDRRLGRTAGGSERPAA
jgi:hypothetical protein